jgi:hypothetical protein
MKKFNVELWIDSDMLESNLKRSINDIGYECWGTDGHFKLVRICKINENVKRSE